MPEVSDAESPLTCSGDTGVWQTCLEFWTLLIQSLDIYLGSTNPITPSRSVSRRPHTFRCPSRTCTLHCMASVYCHDLNG